MHSNHTLVRRMLVVLRDFMPTWSMADSKSDHHTFPSSSLHASRMVRSTATQLRSARAVERCLGYLMLQNTLLTRSGVANTSFMAIVYVKTVHKAPLWACVTHRSYHGVFTC